MNSVSDEVNKWYESLKDQKLKENETSSGIWCKYKSDLETTKSLLSMLPKKINHNVMVPIGPKALMKGKIVHTNEFLVNLGETWFVKRTASQTEEICNRRIKTCEEMLKKLENEKQLIVNKSTLPTEQEAFGNEERPEIIEYVTEEENEEWKKQHRIKEKEYRLQLANLRNKEKTPIKTEEDLWKHLDELELQEELEDELNRLNEEYPNEEDDSEENSESESILDNRSISSGFVSDKSEEKTITSSSEINSTSKFKPRVTFSENCDFSNEDEPLRLEIRHTATEYTKTNDNNSNQINSPSDIYEKYKQNLARTSVLKKAENPNLKKELEKLRELESSESEDDSIVETGTCFSTSIQFNDVRERQPFSNSNMSTISDNTRKISKFKAARQKKF